MPRMSSTAWMTSAAAAPAKTAPQAARLSNRVRRSSGTTATGSGGSVRLLGNALILDLLVRWDGLTRDNDAGIARFARVPLFSLAAPVGRRRARELPTGTAPSHMFAPRGQVRRSQAGSVRYTWPKSREVPTMRLIKSRSVRAIALAASALVALP